MSASVNPLADVGQKLTKELMLYKRCFDSLPAILKKQQAEYACLMPDKLPLWHEQLSAVI